MRFMFHAAILLSICSAKAQPGKPALQDSIIQLDEVIISTGIEQLPAERSTGSFSHIDAETFGKQVSTDIFSRLEVLVSGYQLDRNTSPEARPLIRGVATLQGPTSPLIVVDNFPYEGDLQNLNPNDVLDISILKDAAAASIWGARAANGVIVIRTKKGRFNQATRIGFTINATASPKPDIYYLSEMSPQEYIGVEQMLYDAGYYDGSINNSSKPPLTPAIELLIKKSTAGEEEQQRIDQQILTLGQHNVRDDFNKYLYKPSFQQQYALSMEGGSEQHAWSALAGYDNNRDNLDAGYQRLNLKLDNSWEPVSWLQVSGGIQLTQSKNENGRPGYGAITSSTSLFPYARLADESGHPLTLTKQYRQTYIDEVNADGRLLDWSYTPLDDYRHITTTGIQQDLLVNTGLIWSLLPGIQLDLKYQYERQQDNGRSLNDLESFYTRDLINFYSAVNSQGTIDRPIPVGGILDLDYTTLESHQFRAQINAARQWGKHELSALAGNEWRHARTLSDGFRYYGYHDDILSFGQVDYAKSYPNYVNGSAVYIPNSNVLDEKVTRFVSFFGNASYTYNRRYTLSASVRRDASNLFGLNTNDQWNAFWSLGLAWNLAAESFYQWAALPDLRFRMTYGASGNVDPAMVAVTTIQFNSGPSFTSGLPWASFANYYNPDLRWETTRMLNTGIDFGSKEKRITGSVEYYRKMSTDLFGNAEIDYTAGIGRTVTKNVSSLVGNGVDAVVSSHIFTGAFTWYNTINLSYYQDRVTENLSFLSASGLVNGLGGTAGISALPGHPAHAILAYRWAGLSAGSGDPQGVVNGQISSNYSELTGSSVQTDDLVYKGSAIPTWYGSFRNSIGYKAFQLEIAVSYQLGYYFRRPSINYSELFYDGRNRHADFAKRWQHPGDEAHTNVPSMIYPDVAARDLFYAGSEVLVERGDHIRLQYVNLSYAFTGKNGGAFPFRQMQVYVNGANLGLLWRANKQGIDPDYNYSSAIPSPASYCVGLKANF